MLMLKPASADFKCVGLMCIPGHISVGCLLPVHYIWLLRSLGSTQPVLAPKQQTC